MRVRIEAVDDTDLDTPAAQQQRRIAQTQEDAESAIENDPLVRRLVERFDGEIVRESIRPINTRSH
jgi:DNA polymerase-3 subunit gamma/tau